MGHSTRALRWLGALACAPLLAGCYTLSYNVDEVYGPAAPSPSIRSFKVEVKHHHLVLGLVTLGEASDIDEAIAREIKAAGGRAASNVRVTHQVSLIDGVIGTVTNSLYAPTTTIVEGDVVR